MTDKRQNFVKFFSKHLITITVDCTHSENPPQNLTLSGFVMSIKGNWLFVTAGHILQTVADAKTGGSNFVQWRIYDGLGPKAKFNQPIPFDYDNARQIAIHDEENGFDYGVIYLRDYYRKLLENNGVEPITEEAWLKNAPEAIDCYVLFMLGVPSEWVKTSIVGNTSVTNKEVTGWDYALLKIDLLDNPPETIQKPHPRIYGEIAPITDGAPESIKGMSGSPIFGVTQGDDGQFRYWVIAIQSGWLRDKRIVAACPLAIFALWLSTELEDWLEEV